MSELWGGFALPDTAPHLPPDDFLMLRYPKSGALLRELFVRLAAEIPWRQESIILYGKRHMQPRLLCWMGDPECAYRYSGILHKPQPWHPLVSGIRAHVEALAGARFNSVLLNQYRDEQDSMGFHADDEPELGAQPVIASLSLGAARVMHLRHRRDRALPTQKLVLDDGDLLVMRGNSQCDWKHAIPKSRKALGPRINLTFRLIRFPSLT